MNRTITIGVMGERDAKYPPQYMLDEAIQHSASRLSMTVELSWVSTSRIKENRESALAGYSALWAAPGWLENVDGALEGIRFARENDVPFFGTCGGFQHAVLEFAKNILKVEDAAHEAYEPSSSRLFLTTLACSIKGKAMSVQIRPASRAFAAYGRSDAIEEYYCSYGINPEYVGVLEEHGLRITGRDESSEPRILEIAEHRFYVSTLFVPQTRSTVGTPHPLITEFVRAAARR